MGDQTKALLGDQEAAKRLTDAGVAWLRRAALRTRQPLMLFLWSDAGSAYTPSDREITSSTVTILSVT